MRNNTVPFGYRLEKGKPVICEEEACKLREVYTGYLSGLSFSTAADKAGLRLFHGTVRNMMRDERYLGTDFFPAIIDEETFNAVEEERQRREKALGRTKRKRRSSTAKILTEFSYSKPEMKYPDPFQQAEYIYSLIKER